MSYNFQRVSQDKITDLIGLFNNSFNWNPSVEYLRQRYDTSTLGPVNLGYLAYAEDHSPAAYYGVFAMKLRIDGKLVSGAQSGDTATHSQHRGKGLFIDLAKASYKLAAEEGVQVVFGFPNKNSYSGFMKKLDWMHTHDIDVFRIKLFTLPVAQAVWKWKNLKKAYLGWVRLFVNSKKIEGWFPGSVNDDKLNGVLRDEAYFTYKRSSDKFLIDYKGSKMWLKFDGFLWVGDMEIHSNEKFDQNVRWLKRIAFFTGCDKIVFQASPGTSLHAQLKRIASPKSTMPAGVLNLNPENGLDLRTLVFTGADFDSW